MEKLTRIPVPWKPSYKDVQPLIPDQAKFVNDFTVFLDGSSATLKKLNSPFIQVLGDFNAEKCTLTAKGCQMEQKVMQSWRVATEVFEIVDVFFRLNKVEMEFNEIHGERQFDYCDFHVARVQQVKESQ